MGLDKETEKRRTAAVKRGLARVLLELGFVKDADGACSRKVDGHTCRVWLQKFRHQPAFRVAMSFHPAGGVESRWVTEFADAWTFKDSPSGRKYDFGIRWGDDVVERCLREMHDFVKTVALAWFDEQIRDADRR